jgi:hypothetical protein
MSKINWDAAIEYFYRGFFATIGALCALLSMYSVHVFLRWLF